MIRRKLPSICANLSPKSRRTGPSSHCRKTSRRGLSRDEQYVAVEELLEKIRYATRTPTVAAIRQMPRFELADTSSLKKPVLCVAVDAEEEFDWRAPFSRRNISVKSISHQYLAQEIFARYGVTPTYLVDYPVATNPTSVKVLRKLLDAGQCEIGAQLHPWVNPPHEEEVTVRNSFPANLPPQPAEAKAGRSDGEQSRGTSV